MGKDTNKLLKIMKYIFGISFVIILVAFILGQIFLKDEGGVNAFFAGEEGYNCKVYDGDWVRVMPDGSSYEVEVPSIVEAYPGEAVSVVTTLPENLSDQTWLCFEGYWQDMEFFVDGVLRERYSTEGTRPFGKNSATTFVFVELFREDAGKELKMVSTTLSSYTGTLNTVYVGDKYGIWLTFWDWYGVAMLLEFVLLIMSSIGLVFCFVLWAIYRKNFDFTFLCSSLFFVASWQISESPFRQLMFRNISSLTAISFLSLILLPVTVIFYINEIQDRRYQKWHLVSIVAGIVNLMITVLLQATGTLDFQECLPSSHGVIVISALGIIVTIAIDCVKKHIKGYGMVAIGLLVAVLSAVVEMTFFYIGYYEASGVYMTLGLMFLFVMASTKTIRELLAAGRERERALHANEAKAKFLANMSHEIRTPINTILGMNEMILRESPDDEVREYAYNIEHSGKMLLALISDVLDFSKIEAGEVEILPVEYHTAGLIFDAVQAVSRRAEKKNLKLTVKAEESLPSVLRGDELRIRQIMNNLMSNAVKYTKEGTVTLDVRGRRNGHGIFSLVIVVEDTGIGIKNEDLPKLFSSFTRLDEGKNRTIEGTGLGLNITKLLVELMQGEITVESEYGKGTRFTVSLPQIVVDETSMGPFRQKYKPEKQDEQAHRSSFEAPEAKLLVVDDNDMNLAVIKGLLKGTKVQIDTALGGLEAMEKSRERSYDIIMLDHMMPTPDGVETLHMLRAEEGNPNKDAKVVVLTANALAGCREEYLAEGFDDYLSKPIDVEKLEQLICKLLPKEMVFMTGVFEDEKESEAEEALHEAATADKVPKEHVNQSVGMRYCARDEEVYREILEAFSEQTSRYQVEMRKMYEEKDWKNYSILVHSLKSTSLGIGAEELSELAKKMEMAAKQQNEELLLAEGEKVFEEYSEVLKEVREILETGRKQA